MRVLFGMISIAAAAAMLFAGTAQADGAQIADLQSRIASLEAARMAPAGGGDAASLTSLRRKGAVRIGGEIELDTSFMRRTQQDARRRRFNKSETKSSNANLRVRVDMTSNAYAFMKLDLDDFLFDDGQTKDGTDLLEEVYFKWSNINGSSWDTQLGKFEMPFGLDKSVGITHNYTHNNGSRNSYLARDFESGQGIDDDATSPNFGNAIPSQHRGVLWHNGGRGFGPGEIDNVFGFQATYNHQDLAKLELAVFQNQIDLNWNGDRMGMYRNRSEDNLGFRSGAARLWLMPLEGLTMQLSFSNQHMASKRDRRANIDYASFGRNGRRNKSALSFSMEYAMQDLPLELYIEYIRGWNQLYHRDIRTDTIQLGFTWGLTEKIDLNLDGQWFGVDQRQRRRDEDLYRVGLTGTYKTDYGVDFMLEYLHEWYRNDIRGWDRAKADVVTFRAAYRF